MSAKRYFTIATALVGLAAASAVYADQDSRWLRQQLNVSDGAPRQITQEPGSAGPEGRPASTFEQRTESPWLSQQLSLSDGAPGQITQEPGSAGPEGRPAGRMIESTAEDAFFERERRISDNYQP